MLGFEIDSLSLLTGLVATLIKWCFQDELKMRKKFFHVKVMQKWNSLSNHAVVPSTLSSFKSVLDLELGDALYAVLFSSLVEWFVGLFCYIVFYFLFWLSVFLGGPPCAILPAALTVSSDVFPGGAEWCIASAHCTVAFWAAGAVGASLVNLVS